MNPLPTPRISDTQEISPALGQPSTGGSSPLGSQSTVDLNMLMDIIETVFDRPSISHFVLMTGDRDFTRICARLKLRLNVRRRRGRVPRNRQLRSDRCGQSVRLKATTDSWS
jgi:hypothetical protein